MAASAPKAVKTNSTFSMECAVAADIRAPAAKIWQLLTDAKAFPRWNTTVTSLDGEIALGQKLKLRVPISERTFTPQVTALEAPRRMVWSDGFAPMFRGVRTYTLTENADGSTAFSMREVYSGLMLPMIRGSLPDFGPPFEQFASDLKRAAES
jgi:uncharacterized protein YndB with AHSA1/START domain